MSKLTSRSCRLNQRLALSLEYGAKSVIISEVNLRGVMSNNYKSQSFGYYLVRVGSVVLGLLFLFLIIWGIFQLDSSSFLSGLVRLILIVFVLLVVGTGVMFGVRLLSANENISFRRILSIGAGLLVFGFIVWGIFRLASSSDEQTEVADTATSSTVEQPASEQQGGQEDSSAARNGSDQQSSQSSGSSQSQNSSRSSAANSNNNVTPSTGAQATQQSASSEDLPNTGVEPEVLSAISVGVLSLALSGYIASKKALFLVDQA